MRLAPALPRLFPDRRSPACSGRARAPVCPAMTTLPATVSSLDLDAVADVLVRHSCNVTNAARDLGVPASDLRRLLWASPQLQDAAYEAVEARLDLAEKNIAASLCADDRRGRLAASMFALRNSHRARKRGWITSSASAAELSVSASADQPRKIVFRWQTSDDPRRRTTTGGLSPRRATNRFDGELATPPVLIEPPEPEPPAAEPIPSPPEPPTLPVWPGPHPPPPLAANRFRPWSPSRSAPQQRREPEDLPQPEPRRRMSRGGYR